MIELLAPAKDKECAKAAIDYGADAVYIGANDFGARKKASNSLEDIKEIVEYAHQFDAKVYVTINTILTDDEIIEAKKLVENLVKINVDAVIVQDMGLFEEIKDIIPVHASTQCDNRNAEKVKFLENAGFSRAILARELSVEQIKEIKNSTDIELEAFIHGALCVSYSGNCYLSYAIGGRSANRGECAQPCRKKYSLVDENGKFIVKDKYLLCLKDFNASDYLEELADAGVTSFKIEGRLKVVNYVKNVVGFYRKKIDNLAEKNPKLQKTSSGKISFDFEPDLGKSFNRGFNDYFLDGKRKEIYSFDCPKSIGEYVGEIKQIGRNFFEISPCKKELNAQDGLCFISGGDFNGAKVNRVEGNNVFPNKMDEIKVGAKVYRNFDCEFEKQLNNSKTCRKIRTKIEFNLNKIKIEDENGNLEELNYDFEEFAQNSEKMKANIINQFSKSGESYFYVENIEILTDKFPFLPVSKLNELRREIFQKLAEKRTKSRLGLPAQQQKSENTLINYPESEIDYRGNVLNESAKDFYENHNCKVTEMALENLHSKVSVSGKVVMTSKHCLKSAFNLCKSPKKLYLIDEKNKRYELKFNCDKCEMEIIF